MASKNLSATAVLFLSFSLLFPVLATSHNPKPSPTPIPNPNPGTMPTPSPTPIPSPSPNPASCPRDALKLGVCVDILNGTVDVRVGTPPNIPCCALLQGLVDLEAAVCLCTAIRANILGINLNIPISLSLILNTCGRQVPSGFQCA